MGTLLGCSSNLAEKFRDVACSLSDEIRNTRAGQVTDFQVFESHEGQRGKRPATKMQAVAKSR